MTSPAEPQTADQPPSATPAPPAPPPPANVDGTARSILGEDQSRTPTLELRQGVVTATDLANARCTVILGGGDTAIPTVAFLSNYKPTVGDTCWVLVNGPDLLALDRDGKFGSAAYAGLKSVTVDNWEHRTSTSYGDLTTFGPQVVTTVPASGQLLVQISGYIRTLDAYYQDGGAISFSLSGANTLAASDRNMLSAWVSHGDQGNYVLVENTSSRVVLLTGLNPGQTTVTVKYKSWRADTDVGFQYRSLWVLPL